MKASRLLLAATVSAMSALALAQASTEKPKSLHDVFSATRPATQPATQPSLPAGHPQVPGLPSGHPEVPKLPSGHPEVPKLPSGHPTVPTTPELPSGHPAVKPGTLASEGTVAVRVVQGTKDGKAIAEGMPVTLELFHRGSVIRKFDAKLDKAGAVTVPKLPLMLPFQPVARVEYGGVSFTAVGQLMDPRHGEEKLEVTIYEVTDQQPAWKLQGWHVVAEPAPDGLRVTEMLAVENPSDRAWTGDVMADGSKLAFRMRIPPGVGQLEVGGLDHANTFLKDGVLGTGSPMVPGVTSLRVSYTLPLAQGKANLNVTAPAEVKSMMLFVPDDGSTVEVKGMEVAPAMGEGREKMRVFKAADLKAGHQAQLLLTPKAK